MTHERKEASVPAKAVGDPAHSLSKYSFLVSFGTSVFFCAHISLGFSKHVTTMWEIRIEYDDEL